MLIPLRVRGVWNLHKADTTGTVSDHPRAHFSLHTRADPHLFSVQFSTSAPGCVIRWLGSSAPLTPSLIQAVSPSCQQWILGLKLAAMHVLWLYHAGVISGADGTKLFLLLLKKCDCECGCGIWSHCRVFSHPCVICEGWCWGIVGFAQLRIFLLEETFWMICIWGIHLLFFFLAQV